VSFTGSTQVGLAIGEAAARRHARVQQEMGGKNTMVVLADCDLNRAVAMAAEGVFGGTGQKCTATGRLLVERSVAADFIDGVCEVASRLSIGDGAEPATQMGPLVTRNAQARVGQLVQDAVAAGASLVLDPDQARREFWSEGHFMGPAVLTGIRSGMRLADEEIFGPVAAVTVVDDLDEAIGLATKTNYGLSASIHTSRIDSAQRFADSLAVGVVNVNQPTTGVEPHLPFGGVLLSGSPHRELGPRALDFYTREQTQVMAVD
jgi:acyl-CoA reductase-like NAD-dependent aldehyde dehydrogenase